VGSEPLERLARRGDRVAILVPDRTRDAPRSAQVEAVFARLRAAGVGATDVVVVVATGRHTDASPPEGGWGAEPAGLRVVIHDGRSDDLSPVGRMRSVRRKLWPDFLQAEAERVRAGVPGTSLRMRAAATAGRARVLRLAPEVAGADLVVSLGVVVPHSIAGFAGGSKMIFPGVADAASIRENHALRVHPSVRRGRIEGNLAREHLEAGVRLLAARRFSLDVLARPGGGVLGAVAGDPEGVVQSGCALVRPALEVRAEPADLVVAVVGGPAARTVYQSTKGVSAAAPLVRPGGTIALLAACEEGVGDVAGTRSIVALGLWTTVPPGVKIVLVAPGAPDLRPVGLESMAELDRLTGAAKTTIVLPDAMHVLAEALPAAPTKV
jgi:nickel-dependent lactate racemase